MNRVIVVLIGLCCGILLDGNRIEAEEFTRAGLQSAVDSYLAAARSGDISKMPLVTNTKYIEDTQLNEGIWKILLKIDFHRSLLDVVTSTNTSIYVSFF